MRKIYTERDIEVCVFVPRDKRVHRQFSSITLSYSYFVYRFACIYFIFAPQRKHSGYCKIVYIWVCVHACVCSFTVYALAHKRNLLFCCFVCAVLCVCVCRFGLLCIASVVLLISKKCLIVEFSRLCFRLKKRKKKLKRNRTREEKWPNERQRRREVEKGLCLVPGPWPSHMYNSYNILFSLSLSLRFQTFKY